MLNPLQTSIDGLIAEKKESPSFSVILKRQNEEPFDGETFEPQRDGKRLTKQLQTVFALLSDGAWWTPKEMEEATGYGWASISARLRDLRKAKQGGHTVNRKSLGKGLFAYQML